MKVEMKIIQAVFDVRQFKDNRTGNTQQRNQLTMAGQLADGELISAVCYLDEKPSSVPSGKVVLDVYRYEASNALMGTITARGYEQIK